VVVVRGRYTIGFAKQDSRQATAFQGWTGLFRSGVSLTLASRDGATNLISR
jgi:hypothetical protein